MVRQHEEERRRVSLELHDQTAQVWAAVKLQLGLVREASPPPVAARIGSVLDLVDTGIRSIRGVTTNLRPPLLDDLGLVPALRALVTSFAEQTGLALSFEAPAHVPRLSEDAQLALFRALQEALSNVARHSGASAARVSIAADKDQLTMRVEDNGHGIAPDAQHQAPGTWGLRGMRERIGALHGSVHLESERPGAALTVRIPMGDAR
jgi:signal transduction histidine kinase